MDTKLSLKPIELIDIGIDKHTKMPMPILTENLVYTNDNDDGVPLNTFVLKLKSTTLSVKMDCEKSISLEINFGDTGYTTTVSGDTILVNYTYPSIVEKTITITGDLNKITGLTCVNVGLNDVDISTLKKLKYLNLSGNTLTFVNLTGLFNLNYIDLNNNNLNSSSTDDVFIQANTFLAYGNGIDIGIINVVGINNSPPSTYSLLERTNLQNIKRWTLNY